MVDAVANIQAGVREFPADEYEVFRDVPVFSEHETMSKPNKDGKQRLLRFTRRVLQQIVDKCNQRIDDTGDYAAIVIGHTPETAEHPEDMPPLVGFAGPYRLGSLPNGKAAVLADFHIRKDELQHVKRFPRRSPELWLADDYADMFFDPISLLGAEAPRLDMGMMLYRRKASGQVVETYSAVFPSAGNTFVPTGDELDDKAKRRYAAGETTETESTTMALSPEDIQEIVSALMETKEMQWVSKQMGGDEAPGEDLGAPEEEAPPAEEPPAEEPPAPAPEVASPAAAPPAEEEKEKNPMQYSKLTTEIQRLKGQVTKLEKQAATDQAARVKAERYAALREKRMLFAFDLDKEVERCSKMSSGQFADHLDGIDANYRRIPEGEMPPIPDGTTAGAFGRPGAPAEREKYSKEHSDEAMRRCNELIRQGKPASYEEVLRQVAAGK